MRSFKLLSVLVFTVLVSACKHDAVVKEVTNRVNDELSKTEYGQYIPKTNPYDNQATATAIPDEKSCLANLYNKKEPLLGDALRYKSERLCFNGFVVLYSGVSKTPMWSAELLTKSRIEQARQMKRVDNFHEETRLSDDMRSRLSDYTQTGYDRGHLSPNADMPNSASQFDSFSLANIAPQDPQLNRGEWSSIESNVRKMVMKYGDAYVVTGTGFVGKNIKRLKGNVMVPTYFYKAVYFPKTNQSFGYIAENTPNGVVQQTDVKSIDKLLGVKIFPTLN